MASLLPTPSLEQAALGLGSTPPRGQQGSMVWFCKRWQVPQQSPGMWLSPTASCPQGPLERTLLDGKSWRLVSHAPACLPWGKGAACPGLWPNSHVFWVVLQAADELTHWLALIAHFVHRSEQGKPRETKNLSSSAYPRSTLNTHAHPRPDSRLTHHFPSLPLLEFNQKPALSCYPPGL